MNKYHAKRTWSELCQRTFASKAECLRGEELRLLELGREIWGLEYQVPFTLSAHPKVTITIDFSYWEWGKGERVYEDVKGVLTRDFRTKLAWLKQLFDIDVILTRGY